MKKLKPIKKLKKKTLQNPITSELGLELQVF